MGRLTGEDLARVALRALLLQATWNYERQQGLGWAWSFQPVLERLYPDAEVRRARLAEHTAYFNTQPTMASIALGAVAQVEEERARGEGSDPEAANRVKGVLGSALAALGDRLFWFTLRPFVACIGVVLALGGSWLGALAMWSCYNVAHLGIRFAGVGWGYRHGPRVLDQALRGRFEAAVRTLAVAGAALVGVLVAVALIPGGDPREMSFQAALVAGLSVGMLTAFRARPSPTQWALGAGVLCLVVGWLR